MDPTFDTALGILPGTTGNVDPSSARPIAGATGVALGTGASQHGIAPASNGGLNMWSAVTNVWDWLNTPFRSPMAPTDIWLMVGVVLVSIILWNLILYHIRIASEAL
jgi:hypothetical protein